MVAQLAGRNLTNLNVATVLKNAVFYKSLSNKIDALIIDSFRYKIFLKFDK